MLSRTLQLSNSGPLSGGPDSSCEERIELNHNTTLSQLVTVESVIMGKLTTTVQGSLPSLTCSRDERRWSVARKVECCYLSLSLSLSLSLHPSAPLPLYPLTNVSRVTSSSVNIALNGWHQIVIVPMSHASTPSGRVTVISSPLKLLVAKAPSY